MTWATIARLFLEIVSRVAGYLRDKQLLDAGRAIERDRLSTEERQRRDDANRARLSAGDDGVFVDPFDAANGRGVPSVPADRLRQPGDPA